MGAEVQELKGLNVTCSCPGFCYHPSRRSLCRLGLPQSEAGGWAPRSNHQGEKLKARSRVGGGGGRLSSRARGENGRTNPLE